MLYSNIHGNICGLFVYVVLRQYGNFLQGKLVYANQGKTSDYEHLNKTVDLRGTIAIVRYGGAGRAAKVRCENA